MSPEPDGRPTGSSHDELPVNSGLEAAVETTLESRDAAAFVHVGTARDPGIRYLVEREEYRGRAPTYAVAYDGREWLVRSSASSRGHPAEDVAATLGDRSPADVLTPARIPHDAALYLESQGFSLSSTDVLERARARKTPAERDRIAEAQRTARAGMRTAASLLASATVADGRLLEGEPLTAERIRTEIDREIVAAGGFPAGNTSVEPAGDLRPGEPIVVAVAPREPGGYHGRLVRTFVVDGDGGRQRRAHVGITQAFRSAQAMVGADTHSVTAVEADLEAEIRAFGEDGPLETTVAGVGLEPAERPLEGSDDIEPGSVVRIEAAVEVDDDWLRLADLLVKDDDGIEWLAAPSRSLSPEALLE